MSRFQMPAPEALDELIHNLNLDDQQAHELRVALYHVDEDLKAWRKNREGRQARRELVRRLKRVAKLAADLDLEVHRWAKTLNDFLPADLQEEMGLLMSFSAMESALKEEIRTPELRSEIESLSSETPEFRMAQIEDRLRTRREARGLEHGGELFMHFLERINQPFKAWLELDRRNKGGRPSKNLPRDYLLFRLAEAARAIIGRRPTATAGGRFVRLCAAVVVACGLDDRGIERAVEKALKELSARRPPGLRRAPKPPATPTETGSRKS
jgi:hypothetical protein